MHNGICDNIESLTSLLAVSIEIKIPSKAVKRYVPGSHFASIAPMQTARTYAGIDMVLVVSGSRLP